MNRINQYLVDAIKRPREQLTRGQHFVRYIWELAVHCWHQLSHHRAEGMAAELTYRTIFALVPLVVIGLVMFRVVGGLDDVQKQVENELYSFFGVPEIPEAYSNPNQDDSQSQTDLLLPNQEADSIAAETSASGDEDETPDVGEALDRQQDGPSSLPTGPDLTEAVSGSESPLASSVSKNDLNDGLAERENDVKVQQESARKARASIRRTLSEVTAKVSTIDFKSIGVFGLILFIYAAIALANSTEDLFNRIYDAPAHRPIHLRLAIHWSIITLGSGLLAMSLYLSGKVVDRIAEWGVGATPQWLLAHVLSITASFTLLFLLYALMPNTKVSLRAAAIGALVGSGLWELAKFGFQIYVAKAVPYSAIYGSIGLIPLFLFWVYVTWLIVLFGMILTFTLQVLRGRGVGGVTWDSDHIPLGDPDWMLPIITEISIAFRAGKPLGRQALADQIGLSGRVVHQWTDILLDAGLLRVAKTGDDEEDALMPARPAEQISVVEVLQLGHQARTSSRGSGWKTIDELKMAQQKAAGDRTIADLIRED